MALPWTFANATTLFTSRLDDNYNALGALTVIPCTATGTNTIALTPGANTPTISAYTNLSPVFAFIAAASSSGAITINVNGIGAKNLYKNNGATAAGNGDIVSGGLYLVSYNSALNSAVGGFVIANPNTSGFLNPTYQVLTSGSGTYTPTAGAVRIFVRMIGGGGGGGGANVAAAAGGTGGTTTFNSVTAIGGGAGAGGGTGGRNGGAGGTGGTGSAAFRLPGSAGGIGNGVATAGGGNGGPGLFGMGAGIAGFQGGPSNGGNGGANTGAGGGGANNNALNGGSGGSGEYVEIGYLTAAPYSYTVGAGGTAGAGSSTGGVGGSGVIQVIEHYF